MIARKVCVFPQDKFSRTRAHPQSWLLLMGRGSRANRSCTAEQSVKGAQRE